MNELQPRQQFAEMMERPDPAIDLSHASLLIACEEYPDLDVAAYLRRLDAMAEDLRERLGGDRRPSHMVATLNHYLFEDEGFKGNTDDYYDPRNSFLNEVLDRRKGIPITLSMLYIEVARRLELSVEGVGLPGHFIVKVLAGRVPLLLDPWSGGTILSEADCQKRLDRIYGGRLRMQPAMLATCDRKAILARMLRNLKGIYTKAGDNTRALGAADLLLAIDPRSSVDLRDRGRLYAALDCYAFAVRDFEACLALSPLAEEAEELRTQITTLRQRAKYLN